jgi:ferrous iron transport protein A
VIKSLTELSDGQSGTISEIKGGHTLINRLAAMGIIPGKKITKVSSMFMKGPLTIKVTGTKVAIGFSMANKILVKVDQVKE